MKPRYSVVGWFACHTRAHTERALVEFTRALKSHPPSLSDLETVRAIATRLDSAATAFGLRTPAEIVELIHAQAGHER